MKYYIAFIIKGSASKYHQKLVKEVGPKFGERRIVDQKNKSHITLKYSFETDNIEEIENIIKKVVKNHNKQKIVFGGFGNFKRFVAYWNPELSKDATAIQKDLIKELRKLKWLEIEGRDSQWKPHSTISFGFSKKSFVGIWNYLNSLEKKEFIVYLDNITILKKPRKYWKIYKSFKIR